MFIHTISRLKRSPFYILAMVLFSTVLVAVLCSLNKNIEDEITAYEEAYRTIPVTVTVCDLRGELTDNLSAPEYVMNALRSDYDLATYLTDVEFKMTIHKRNLTSLYITLDDTQYNLSKLVGITATSIDSLLAQKSDNAFAWFEGYDESVLEGRELVCIVHENLIRQSDGNLLKAKLVAHYQSVFANEPYQILDVKIIGTHSGEVGTIYCPFFTVHKIGKNLGLTTKIDAASAVISDNFKLEEFRGEMLEWFPEPNDTGEKTDWERGYNGIHYYPVAMKIDDSRLHLADAAMQNSIKINTLCSYVVLCLSAVAGFFVGFLAIRSRKREITLMRSLGNSGLSIFTGCCAEQLLCLVLGTAIGGAAFMWRPIEQIGIFMGIYFIGTIISLVIFISRNLLQGQKEDE